MVTGLRYHLKTGEEIEIIRQNCLLVCATIAEVGKYIKPGVSGSELDKIAEDFIRDNDAEPAFKGYPGTVFDFPSTLCISFNEVVVHGIPNGNYVKEGDIVSIDCGVKKNGFFGDAAFTFAVGEVDPQIMKLLLTTRQCLDLAIEQAVSGNRLGDIGFAVQNHAESNNGYGVIREMVGHGIGKRLHEPPDVPNYGKRGKGGILPEGLVIAIEPMINLGSREIVLKKDGWTLVARDAKPSAHYEHTVAVGKGKADVLSDHGPIDAAVKNNANLSEVWIKK